MHGDTHAINPSNQSNPKSLHQPQDTHSKMRARASAAVLLLVVALAACGTAGAVEAKPTLEDCKAALLSLNEKPWSTSLPSMAAATGAL